MMRISAKRLTMNSRDKWNIDFNPLPPSDAVRKQKKIFKRIFFQYRLNLKNITPLETWNLIIKAFNKAWNCVF